MDGMGAEQVQVEIDRRLRSADLHSVLVQERSQYLDFPDSTFVELVLNDDSRKYEISQTLKSLGEDEAFGKPISVLIHSLWMVDKVGEPEQARSENGGIVAARLVPVWLRSGASTVKVEVSITHLAEMEMRRLHGQDPDLKHIADAYVQSHLKWGGKSAWEPSEHRYLEITADRAAGALRLAEESESTSRLM